MATCTSTRNWEEKTFASWGLLRGSIPVPYTRVNSKRRKMCKDVVVASPSKAPCILEYSFYDILSQLRVRFVVFSPRKF